jgi:hypothetical protein
VHGGPESPVGKAVVVLLPVDRPQVHEGVLYALFVDDLGMGIGLGRDLAAPAEPQPALGLERLAHRDRKATRGSLAARVRGGHSVGDHNEPRQVPSPVPPLEA